MATEDKPKFTPGPWECFPSIPEDGFECFWIRARRDFGSFTRGFRIVDIGSVNGPQSAEQKANARLIATAPDMYEALKMAQLWLEIDGRYDMRTINAAIKKAEGRQS